MSDRRVRSGFDRRLVVDGRELVIQVRRSSRARRVRLVVRPDEPVELILPGRATLAQVEPFLAENHRWLRDKVAWARSITERQPFVDLGRPHVVWVGAEPIPVRREGGTRSVARIERGVLVVAGFEPRAAVERWYRREARRVISDQAREEGARLGNRYRSISIRDPRTRWGSCSAGGDLSFSWRLLLAPPSVLRYVVIHELCHLPHRNHGPGFRRALATAEPGWREDDRWLTEHGHELRAYRPLP